MDSTYVIDDWLEKDLAEYINEILVKHIPVYFNHLLIDKKVIGVHLFEIFHTDTSTYNLDRVLFKNYIVDYLYFKLTKIFQFDFKVKRCYLNFYPHGVNDVGYHTDGSLKNEFTVLYMVSNTPSDESGAFEYVDLINNSTKQINFIQNRLIIFKSNIQHRGISFNDRERLTLTFKCQKINENCINN